MVKNVTIPFKKQIIEIGGSYYLAIDPELVTFMKFEKGTEVYETAQIGKHGKFIAVWRVDQKKEE